MSDLIDRQEAIDALERYSNDSDMPYEWHRGIDAAKEIISVVLTAEPKKGCWLDALDEDPCYYRCSECGRLSGFLENFCPECGADMKGEKR